MKGLLEWSSLFDWVSPLWAGLQDLINGPGHTFKIYRECGWSGNEIERLLRRHGVKTWGLMIPAYSEVIMITVPEKQRIYAARILIENALLSGTGEQLSRDGRSLWDMKWGGWHWNE